MMMLRVGRQRKTSAGFGHQPIDALSRLEKINSATSSARGNSRAPQMDGIAEALGMLDDAVTVLEHVRTDLRLLAEPVIAASAEPDSVTRALFADEYDERRDALARHVVGPQDAAAVLLSQDGQEYGVPVDDALTYRIGRFPMALSPEGLGLPAPAGGFSEMSEVISVLKAIEGALDKIDRVFTRYSQDKTFLERKLAFLKDSVVSS